MYGQGGSWDTCQPAGFLSKKFMSTLHNYHTHEHIRYITDAITTRKTLVLPKARNSGKSKREKLVHDKGLWSTVVADKA